MPVSNVINIHCYIDLLLSDRYGACMFHLTVGLGYNEHENKSYCACAKAQGTVCLKSLITDIC